MFGFDMTITIKLSDAMAAHVSEFVTRQKRAASGDAEVSATEQEIAAYLRRNVLTGLQHHLDGTMGMVPATAHIEAQIAALSDKVRDDRVAFSVGA